MKTKYCLILAAALMSAACNSPQNGTAAAPAAVTITGAGSTFVYPLMARWAADFHASHAGISINYQSIGSGGGIQQVKNGTVDFGASDAVLSDQQLISMPALVQIAESAGPVCITYNLKLKQPLRLTGSALAGIYLGTITRWDDARIAAANPDAALPHTAIEVVHRSEGSGTTSIFTNYLAAVSPAWKSRVGAGLAVSWPAGVGGKGSEGVTGVVEQTPGAIGYVELSYAEANQLPVARVQNRAGKWVAPTADSAAAAIAADNAVLNADIRTPIVNAPGAASYPITGLTFLILPKASASPSRQSALREFVEYILGPGQHAAAALHYAPLPRSLQQTDERLLGNLQGLR